MQIRNLCYTNKYIVYLVLIVKLIMVFWDVK